MGGADGFLDIVDPAGSLPAFTQAKGDPEVAPLAGGPGYSFKAPVIAHRVNSKG
jgi:hypothetical protein